MTEELIEALSRSSGMRVIPHATAKRFKGKSVDSAELSASLGVDTLVEGSIRRDSHRVRVTLRALRVPTGEVLLARTFDRPADAAIEAQEEIARNVLEGLGSSKTGASVPQRVGTSNMDAYNCYLRARYLGEELVRERQGLTRAIWLLNRAVTLDPNFAEAWAVLGGAYLTETLQANQPAGQTLPKAISSIERALQLNPSSVNAHRQLSQLCLYFRHDFACARSELETALNLAPDDSSTLQESASYWLSQGKMEVAEEYVLRATTLDPLNPWISHTASWTSMMRGRYREAVERAAAVLNHDGENHWALLLMCTGYERLGRIYDALPIRRRLGMPDSEVTVLRTAFERRGLAGYARTLAGWIESEKEQPPIDAAELYAIAGDADDMYRLLEKGVEQCDPSAVFLGVDPVYRAYRAEQRFQRLLKAAGFIL